MTTILNRFCFYIIHMYGCMYVCIGDAGAAQRVHQEEAAGVRAHHR